MSDDQQSQLTFVGMV